MLSEYRVNKLHKKFKRKALRCYKTGRFDECLKYAEAASYTAYEFNLGFKDDELEELLVTLSRQIKTIEKTRERNVNTCVFYDCYSVDNGGLVQQYLTAIIAAGYKLFYITERPGFTNRESDIRLMLNDYSKVKIFEIPPACKGFKRSQYIYDLIADSDASKLFIHTTPRAVCPTIAFNALPEGIGRYKINLTNHTFWIGASCVDYSFEFNPYGCELSMSERGLVKERLFYLPFYPIMKHRKFEGFPVAVKERFVIVAGGAYYKIFDKDDTFFKLVNRIVEHNPEVLLLYAGDGDRDTLMSKIRKHGLEGSFVPIGQRKDITEVFEHCDAFLNTYPISGGLMTQYAAQLGKPVLNYYSGTNSKVEDFTCQKNYVIISDTSFDAVAGKVRKLIDDSQFRKYYADKIRSCVIDESEFNKLFHQIVEEMRNVLPYKETEHFVPRKYDINDKINYENVSHQYQRVLVKLLGLSSIIDCPLLLFDAVMTILKENRFFSATRNRLFKY